MLIVGLALGVLIGYLIGGFIMLLGQLQLEKGYEENKIAKINGNLYRITELEDFLK